MATSIVRRGIGAKRLQRPEEVRQVFAERFKARFGEWLSQGAFGELSGDSAIPLVPGTNSLQETSPSSESESLLDEDSFGDADEKELGANAAPNSATQVIWPLRYTLTSINEASALTNMAEVTDWVRDWHQYGQRLPAGVAVQWLTRQWPKLGEQTLPTAVTVESAEVLAQWVGTIRSWNRACVRRDQVSARFKSAQWPALWKRHLEVFVDWSDDDFERLQTLLEWFIDNPTTGLYLRQLPVPGIDTKWIETRRAVVRDCVLVVHGQPMSSSTLDFHEVCGLRKPASKLRVRILCPKLRASLGGLCDIEAPVEEIGRMELTIRGAFIVENLETGLALPDFDGMVVFMRLGHAISELARIPWLKPDHLESAQGPLPQLLYWGDLDTHGFVILSRARGIFSRLKSVLMDEATFLGRRELWVKEKTPSRAAELKCLMSEEEDLYVGLRDNKWGTNLRLEQERLPWKECLQTLEESLR
jgi:hypothetical protein